jgi:outer membrane protein OmpA-like peptidoglycan-associated protein
MAPQRRDAERETAEAVDRIWQVYADEIGIPPAGQEGLDESDAEQDRPFVHAAPAPRGVARRRVPTLVAVSAVVVAVTAALGVWSKTSRAPDSSSHRSSTVAASPPGDARPIAPPSADPSSAKAPAPARTPIAATAPIAATGRTGSEALSAPPIHFDFDSDRLSDESKLALDKLAIAMRANPRVRLTLEGHTDAHGTREYNQALSERRARAVKAYLEGEGIEPGRLTAVGVGDSRPIRPNDALGSSVNRRVEFHPQ